MRGPAEPSTPAEAAGSRGAAEVGDATTDTLADGPQRAAGGALGKRVPDFFIVGHSKCGTTALYLMLKRHPQIFMPEVKEPRFFAPELLSPFREQAAASGNGEPTITRHRYTLDAYLDLFAAAEPQQRAGEASPIYLRSTTAAGRIAEVQPDARIIAILREPASFLRSLHLQSLHNHIESEKDFGKALALEPTRREGRQIPRGCHTPQALMYSEHVRYVQQLQSFHAAFPADNVLVLIYDDFRRDNEATVRRVLRFLDVDDSISLDAVETNRLKAVRSQRLHAFRQSLWAARHKRPTASRAARLIDMLTPRQLRGELGRNLFRRVAYDEAALPDERLMLEVRRRFKGEVLALSEYLGRDLVGLWGYDQLD
jgi:hypothetical protein